MSKDNRYLFFIISPSDIKINDAVTTWRDERGYTVDTIPITNTGTFVDDITRLILQKDDKVRLFFTESAWGSLTSVGHAEVFARLLALKAVKWIHLAKKE